MKPFVSIIIPTYNREEPLRRTLTSVFAQKYPAFETIVVDQTKKHSVPTQEFFKKHRAAFHHLRQNKPGITIARNAGLKKAKGEIIIYIDDDVELPQDFIARHVKNYRDGTIAGVTGKITEAHGKTYPDGNKCKDQTRDWWHITFNSEKRGPIARVAGGNMSFRRDALEEIGGFDEKFSGVSWGEETDVSFRLRQKGHILWFDPDAKLTHFSEPEGGTRALHRDVTLDPSLYASQSYFLFKNLPWHRIPKYLILGYRYFVCRKPARGKFLRRNKLFFKGMIDGARLLRRA